MFCHEYVVDLNGQQAAERAGYKAHSARQMAYKLLTKRDVVARVAELAEARTATAKLTVDKVLADLELQRALAIEAGDIKAANRASELQGKYLAMFTDKFKTEVDQTIEVVVTKRYEGSQGPEEAG